jgi:hypothetical protein
MRISGLYLNALGMLSLVTLLSACITQESHPHPDVTVYPDKLYATVNRLVTVKPARSFNNQASLEGIAQYIKSKYSEYGLPATEQEYVVRGVTYWNFGYDAVMITDTSFYRNAHYHKMNDTPDTFNHTKMAEVVKGVYWALINLRR